ncbi:MAG: di-trans,poly-cis-decaprenylcistransferase [Candidatus Aenigmarchaeota archaeon]|nr:di-trans,poly-cis-decaprenylcistransferase [Candidatus Aenigmarchaeota archaeon]
MKPNHIAVIIDGNRRWAKKHGLKPWKGHKKGAENIKNFLKWCLEEDIKEVSVYVLSTENLNRSKEELDKLFELFKKFFSEYFNKDSFIDKNEVKVRFAGDFSKLPKDIIEIMNKVMKKTEKYNKKILNVLIAYGGRYDIVQAAKKCKNFSEKELEKNLLVSEPVDLVIRTGGYNRLSNLMLWQCAYAELYFTKKLWPDFRKKDFIKALKWFKNIKRNFGK